MPAHRCWSLALLTSLLLPAAWISAQTNEPWAGTYQYDGAGNVKAIGQNRYVYDGAMRLRQGTQQSVQQYAYDAFGNLLGITTNGRMLAMGVARTTNRADDPTRCPENSTCFLGTFDEAGNQTGFGSTTYTYDSAGMATALSAPAAERLFIYDAADQRIATVAYGSTSSQTWHYTVRDLTAQVVREVDNAISGSTQVYRWQRDYVRAGGRLIAAADAGPSGEVVRHLHLDHLGSPRLITKSGAIKVAIHTYWPFGADEAGDVDDERMKFTGHERDLSGDGNDLDYMHARYYSNVAGRFLSIDPQLDVRRTSRKPQGWNRYAYVRNGPLGAVDPTGRYQCDASPRECKAIEESMEKIRLAAAAMRAEHLPGAAVLNHIAKMYGKLGQETGVTVTVQDGTGEAQGWTGTSGQFSQTTTITLLRAYLGSNIVRNDPWEIAATLVHEGEHGLYQRAYGTPKSRAEEKNDEISAYRAGGYIHQYYSHDDRDNGIWDGESGWSLLAIDAAAERSTQTWCGGSCPP